MYSGPRAEPSRCGPGGPITRVEYPLDLTPPRPFTNVVHLDDLEHQILTAIAEKRSTTYQRFHCTLSYSSRYNIS